MEERNRGRRAGVRSVLGTPWRGARGLRSGALRAASSALWLGPSVVTAVETPGSHTSGVGGVSQAVPQLWEVSVGLGFLGESVL